jgi:quercetin dioxygenase-like cupin family protein
MKKDMLLAVAGRGLLVAGFAGCLMLTSHFGQAQEATAPAAKASASKMTPKEPVATPAEFKDRVIHQPDLPETELVEGSNSRLVVGEQSMISFLTMDAHSYFAPHHHVQEQIMIVLSGSCDEIIEGKLYHVKAGDVVILPSNVVHGAYINDEDVHVIDVFGSPRSDYMMKMMQVMVDMNKKKAQTGK